MSASRAPTFRALPPLARVYIASALGLAALAFAAEIRTEAGPHLDPGLLVLAAVLCAAGNLFEVFAPAHFSFQPNLIVFLGASLLLPAWAVPLLAAVSFVPGWLVHRFRWYMVVFNIANYALAGTAAHAIARLGGALGSDWAPSIGTATGLAGAALAFVAINHALITVVVTVSRRRPLRKSARDMLGCLPMDIALAMTGACLAALWAAAPPLGLLAVGPVLLIYRALWVPLLEHKSRTDPKTGLYNSEYLAKELEDAVSSAQRRDSGLALVMIDLDQLRMVNNQHGHLAGDELIRAVAAVISEVAAENQGTAARFGGDELCILLPDRSLELSRQVAEDARARIAALSLSLNGAGQLAITASAGIACYPEHADTAGGLLEAADGAVYDAKLGGRNRTRMALPPAARQALHAEPSPSPLQVPPTPIPEPSDPTPSEDESSAHREPDDDGEASSGRQGLIKLYVGLLFAGAALLGLLSSHAAISNAPLLFVALGASVVLLDAVRIDVFERANLSPASVPELALAYFFGPLGPIAAEAVIALGRAVRRDPLVKWSFDFGALSLAGAAAAATFSAYSSGSGAALLAVAALAGSAYYAVNSAFLAVVMGLAEGRSPLAVWRERLAWMVPHYVAFGLLAGIFIRSELTLGAYAFAVFGLPVLMLWIAEKQYLDRSRADVARLRASHDELEAANARLRGLLDENQELLGRMHRSYLSTITSLARTVEAKDPYTGGHTERVAQIALVLARELGVDESQLAAINVGAIIHDIGKVGIPDEILLKRGPLDTEEWREMRRHPELSSYIVADLELPPVVKHMVRSHHERFDGGGYPDGLAGEEIPLAARILCVADALDAMTSDRPYRKALALDAARAEILKGAGTQFCPRVVASLVAAMDRSPETWATLTGAGTDADLSNTASQRKGNVPEAAGLPVA